MVTQRTHNPWIAGSSPAGPTRLSPIPRIGGKNLNRKKLNDIHGLGIAPEGDLSRVASDIIFFIPVVLVLLNLVLTRLL